MLNQLSQAVGLTQMTKYIVTLKKAQKRICLLFGVRLWTMAHIEYHDSYYGIYIKDDYEKLMSKFVRESYKEFILKTNFGAGVLPDRLNKDIKISEIYDKNELCSSDTTIYVKQSSANKVKSSEALEKIAQNMVDNKLVGSVYLYIVFDRSFGLVGTDSLFDLNLQDNSYKNLSGDVEIIYVNNNLEIKK